MGSVGFKVFGAVKVLGTKNLDICLPSAASLSFFKLICLSRVPQLHGSEMLKSWSDPFKVSLKGHGTAYVRCAQWKRGRTGERKIDPVQVNHSQMDQTSAAKTQLGSDRANRTPVHNTQLPFSLWHTYSKPHQTEIWTHLCYTQRKCWDHLLTCLCYQ